MSLGGNVTVLIPAPLRKYTSGEARVAANGATIGEVIESLENQYPGIRDRVVEPDGEIRRFVNIFVNGENARQLDGASTSLKTGDEVGIIPAMAGGLLQQ
jgi:molybdopterin synthase sulfur carrier subunit